MDSPLTKAQLRAKLGSDAAIAAFFGISRAAVAQWPEAAPVPQLRQLQAERMRPEWFTSENHASRHRPGAAPEGGAAAEAAEHPVSPVSEAA